MLAHNNSVGGCWVTMDGAVFDLEAWLPEHPGGATIIPQQARRAAPTRAAPPFHPRTPARATRLYSRLTRAPLAPHSRPTRASLAPPSRLYYRQALNLDCAVFFELYHASRESFGYLREFYIGEVHPEDRALVPSPDDEQQVSAEFVRQLQEFCALFRMDADAAAAAATKSHLGA